jgi:hypothetical protein
MKPTWHAESSAKRYGGKMEDYLPIHDLMDSSKAALGDVRHRALTHNSWFISVIIEKIFGHLITNSDGKQVSTRDIAEQHVLEDFGNRFIPTVCDYLGDLEFVDWMNGTLNKNKESVPRSFKKIYNRYPIKKETQVSVPVDINPESPPRCVAFDGKDIQDEFGGRRGFTVD